MSRDVALRLAAVVLSLGVMMAATGPVAAAESGVKAFVLPNGMEVVVVPDRRVPVVTHMVWYRVGAADDPAGKSGLAHFLEHLMFKGTRTLESGAFARIVTGLGGRHNALTTHDTTSYFQRTAKVHLKRLMELEADRMAGLQFTEAEVETERGVVREERRGSIDGAPIAALNEQMLATLYREHPYRRPVLGWPAEIAGLTLDDAKRFYAHHYAPSNAVLVVAGDVTANEVRAMALETYGKLPHGAERPLRKRPEEPQGTAPRRTLLEDARVGAPMVLRYYRAPGAAAGPRERAALAVLARVLGGDDTSRIYRRLVLDTEMAAHAGADYQSGGLDGSRMALLALARDGVDPARLEAGLDAVVEALITGGVSEDELARAKRVLEAQHVFETDDQEKRARRYGLALTLGQTVADVDAEARSIADITAAEVVSAARAHLRAEQSATGILRKPEAPKSAGR